MRLQDKVAIVTGAGAGIGEAIARRFAAEGGQVLVADIDGKNAKAVADAIRADGGVAFAMEGDVSREDAAHRIADKALEHFSRIDILVNNAANFVHKRVEDATAEDWQAVLGVNVIGTSLCSKHAVAAMKQTGGGNIVNIASINGLVAMPEWMTYNASKAAIVEMSKSMAMDLAPFNIRVNCVCPGMTMTPALRRAIAEVGAPEEEVLRVHLAPHALIKRWGRPEEIAAGVLFLASDEASYVTGTTLVIDGGFIA
jgi:NAD(P)-dependent dehydrogenase (short-subunit alcohol dehydrogenase family)